LHTIISGIFAFKSSVFPLVIVVIIAAITLFLIVALIVLPLALFIERFTGFVGVVIRKLIPNIIRRHELRSYDPDWVLKKLLSYHPQEFSYREIVKVLADCVPHDAVAQEQGKKLYGNDYFSFSWHWILELGNRRINSYVYLLGWFDPRLWEPTTTLNAWLFRTPEEAVKCVITEMKVGKGITKPDNRIHDFLMTQIKNGRKVREYTD